MLIENIAIIEALDIPFEPGLIAITGETGSGKSLILDAFSRVFDKKAGMKELLRHDASRGLVELTFDWQSLQNHKAIQKFLEQAGIALVPGEEELVVSREVTATGTRTRINGSMVTAEIASQLGNMILEIFGQHDLHQLFSPARQRDLLDGLGGEPLLQVKDRVRQSFRRIQDLEAQRGNLHQMQMDTLRERQFLQFQIQEILDANLQDADEDEKLSQERERLANREKLLQAAYGSMHLLTGTDDHNAPSILQLLAQLQKEIAPSTTVDSQFQDWSEVIQAVQETLKGLSQELYRYSGRADIYPERLQEIVDRLDVLEKLKRKYGGSLSNVLKTASRLETELESMQASSNSLNQIEAELNELRPYYIALCNTLTDLRQSVRDRLVESVRAELEAMMLPYARFDIAFANQAPGEGGQEYVTFLFSANPGEPMKELSQVASGGELARLMLAIKIHTAHTDALSMLILDEIDAGMSGLTLRAISEKLVALSAHCQIICVTHHPILAARAHGHLHVEKTLLGDRAHVGARWLTSPTERELILARLASGQEEDTTVSREFIQQLRK